MTADIHKILKDYWGFNEFRPLQEDIINAAIQKKDTLALLPTGGGKSICFQVPILAKPGIGLVISPLIALMNDQVENLKNRGIRALSISAGLTAKELDIGLENCVNGLYKFLYLSPERLQSSLVQERLKRMDVNLLVVDEAHCISQWGYDFRPAYTQIKEVREILPDCSVLALTATATPKVAVDIQKHLAFNAPHVLQKSFLRKNLSYNINLTENKWAKTLQIINRIKGSTLIYLRSRKQTVQVAQWLARNGLSADYYHAGLGVKARLAKQQSWINNKTQIIVCTNAFGMGIDKADVRLVIHLDLPDSLEAYFQEAGRAGRNEQKAFAVMLVSPSDGANLRKKYLDNFPSLKEVKRVYEALSNYYQLIIGMGEGSTFQFDFGDFCDQYHLPPFTTNEALTILEKEGLICLNESLNKRSKLWLKMEAAQLYQLQLSNSTWDKLIKTLVRSYGGLQVEFTSINEELIAKRANLSVQEVKKCLKELQKRNVLVYLESKGNTEISFVVARLQTKSFTISKENLEQRFEDRKKRIEAVIAFTKEQNVCRSKQLLHYFGEQSTNNCGQCDVCRKSNQTALSNSQLHQLIEALRTLLSDNEGIEIDQIIKQVKQDKLSCLSALRWMIDNKEVTKQENRFIKISEKNNKLN